MNCDAPLDKKVKFPLGWREFAAMHALVDMSDPVTRIMMLKVEISIAHLLRITEHTPKSAKPSRKESGRLEKRCFIFLPNPANPTTLVIDPMI